MNLIVDNVTFETNNRKLVRNIAFSLTPGELLAIVGANGAGKSTLLKLVSGEKKASEGNITLLGKNINAYSPKELAFKRAVLNQKNIVTIDFKCEEIVMMGRYPHFGNKPGETDCKIVEETMEICGVTHLAERSYLTLSGGEQQRVQFARVLAQVWENPNSLILMDEPVTGMDVQFQHQTLAIAKALCERGFMVIAVLHDLNLAAQYASRILMLKNGRKWKDGTAFEVLNTKNIYAVFNVDSSVSILEDSYQINVVNKEIRLEAGEFNSFLRSEAVKAEGKKLKGMLE